MATIKARLAFLCRGNSCRSIMAEAMTNHFFGLEVEAVSAGFHPLGWVAAATLTVLIELQVPTLGLRSKGLGEIELDSCQAIINISGYDLNKHLPPTYRGRVCHRHIADPFGFDLNHYRQARDAIRQLLDKEISHWLTPVYP